MGKEDNFADRLLMAIEEKKNPSVIGLDPRVENLPEHVKESARREHGAGTFAAVASAFQEYCFELINHLHDIIPAVKPNIAFWECYGNDGIDALNEVIRYADDHGLVIIMDSKRNDIGSTAKAYADGLLGEVELLDGTTCPSYDVHATTVNGYLGSDGVNPFLHWCKERGRGVFVLDKTSNPSAGELQDRKLVPEEGEEGEETVSLAMARLIDGWGNDCKEGDLGFYPVGAVVGAKYIEDAKRARAVMPKSVILLPGYGAQGGTSEDAVHSFDPRGRGVVVNSSRGIIFAYQKEPYKGRFGPEKFGDAARAAAIDMRDDLVSALKSNGKGAIYVD